MKLKTTFFLTAAFLIGISNVTAQTYVYNEAESSGIFFESPNGAEVSNPISDAVNSSANCAFSGTDNPFPWLEIQFFPNDPTGYTPVSGDKLFFSVHNPNSAPGAQIQFNSGALFGGNVTYGSGSQSGWEEYSITLDDEIGNALTQIILFPQEGTNTAVYIDNIYFAQNSVLIPESPIVYDETTSSGMFFESPNGAEVTNPLSDATNSSANCAFSGTDNPFPWLEIQYFPTYTPVSGDKMFFSVYNPDASPGAQIQFNDGAYFGGNITYSGSGWQEYEITLDDEIGNTITKITLYPTEGTSIGVYVDNIYFAQSSTLSTQSFNQLDENFFVDTEGSIQFAKSQLNTKLLVFDITGRQVINETINGSKSSKRLSAQGIYIVKIENDNGTQTKKVLFQ